MTAGPLDPWDRRPDPRDPMTLTGDLLADANRWCLDALPPRPAPDRPARPE